MKMKYIIILIGVLSLLLAGCGSEEVPKDLTVDEECYILWNNAYGMDFENAEEYVNKSFNKCVCSTLLFDE